MAYLSEIKMVIDGEPFTEFLDINIHQGLYGYNAFSVTCRFDSIEDIDEFLIEKSKQYLGSTLAIQVFVRELDDENVREAFTYRGLITRVCGTRTTDDDNGILLEGENLETILRSKPRTRHFLDKSLEDIVGEVLKPYDRELLKPHIAPRNNQRFEYMVQYQESDLEFLQRLSIRFGEWFYHNNEELIFGEKNAKDADLVVGEDIDTLSYSIHANPVNFDLRGFNKLNPTDQFFSSGSASVKLDHELNMIGKYVKNKTDQVYHETPSDYYAHYGVAASDIEEALRAVVELKARTDAARLMEISGSSSIANIIVGHKINFKGHKTKSSGMTDYGRFLITQASYSFDNDLDFHCSFHGISAETTLPENTDPGLIRQCAQQIALVADNKDPEKLGRIKIRFHWMEEDQSSHWIQINTPYVQKSAGFYFVPAQGTQVMVGFEGGDADRPYCEGNYFCKKFPPDEAWAGNYDEGNAKTFAIRTARGQTIELHDTDEDEKIRIYTSGNKKQSAIELNDSNGELHIHAGGDMTIKVDGKLTISASEMELNTDAAMHMKAGGDLKQEGSTLKASASSIEIKANASLLAEGDGTAEIKSGGITTIKGSVVKIN